MKNRFIRLKNDFSELHTAEKIFDLFVIVLMVTATVIQALKEDDGFTTLQLSLNIAASMTMFLARLLFKEGSLLGSLSMKCQKYINIIVLIGSFGGQFLSIGHYIENYDTVTHLVTGSVICFIGYHIYEYQAKEPAYLKPSLCSTYSFFTSMSFALFWEIFEFTSDFITGSTCQGYDLELSDDKFFYFRWFGFASKPELQYALYDTFADVYAALITAVITAVIIAAVLKKKKSAYELGIRN